MDGERTVGRAPRSGESWRRGTRTRPRCSACTSACSTSGTRRGTGREERPAGSRRPWPSGRRRGCCPRWSRRPRRPAREPLRGRGPRAVDDGRRSSRAGSAWLAGDELAPIERYLARACLRPAGAGGAGAACAAATRRAARAATGTARAAAGCRSSASAAPAEEPLVSGRRAAALRAVRARAGATPQAPARAAARHDRLAARTLYGEPAARRRDLLSRTCASRRARPAGGTSSTSTSAATAGRCRRWTSWPRCHWISTRPSTDLPRSRRTSWGSGWLRSSRAQAYGFFTDTSVCIGCKACEVACHQWNAAARAGRRPGPLGDRATTTPVRSRTPTGGTSSSSSSSDRRDRRPGPLADDVGRLQALRRRPLPGGLPDRRDHPDRVRHGLHPGAVCNGCRDCIAACPFGVIHDQCAEAHRPEMHVLLRPAPERPGPGLRPGLPDRVDPVRSDRRAASEGRGSGSSAARAGGRRGPPLRRATTRSSAG